MRCTVLLPHAVPAVPAEDKRGLMNIEKIVRIWCRATGWLSQRGPFPGVPASAGERTHTGWSRDSCQSIFGL